MKKTISIIGCGRLGQSFARLLSQTSQYCLVNFYSRTLSSAQQARALANGQGRVVATLSDLTPVDLYCISVNDDQIFTVAQALSQCHAIRAVAGNTQSDRPVVFHCSGGHPSTLLSCLSVCGLHIGSVHPALNIHEPVQAAAVFKGTYCVVEAPQAFAQSVFQALVLHLAGVPISLAADQKCLYHAACVFISNFSLLMAHSANTLLMDTPVSLAALLPLLKNTVQQICDSVEQTQDLSEHAHTLQHVLSARFTGPAARKEHAFIAQQYAAIQAVNPSLAALYQDCSARILSVLAKNSLN